jgi:hypothetical protein
MWTRPSNDDGASKKTDSTVPHSTKIKQQPTYSVEALVAEGAAPRRVSIAVSRGRAELKIAEILGRKVWNHGRVFLHKEEIVMRSKCVYACITAVRGA